MSKLLKMWIVVGNQVAEQTDKAAVRVFRIVGGDEFANSLKAIEGVRKDLYARFKAGEITEADFIGELALEHAKQHLEQKLLLNWADKAEALSAILKDVAKDF